MSHLTHKDIVMQWNQYKHSELNKLCKYKKNCNRCELIGFLYALALIGCTSATKNIEQKTLLFTNSALIAGAAVYIDVKKQKHFKQEQKRLRLERQRFFNQFQP